MREAGRQALWTSGKKIQAKKRAGKIPVVGMGLESLWLAGGPMRLKLGLPG